MKLPEFYILPKIHKTPISSRPIVPNHSWLTCNASRWLSDQLNDLVKKFTWIVENQIQVILNLENEEALRLPEDCILVAADVESL